MNIYGIILAAGTSSRMEELKQLLQLGEKSILEHVVNLALSEDFSKIITVIGHEAEQLKKKILIHDPRFKWVVNEHYLAGQSTSIKAGVREIEGSHINTMIFLADLPLLSTTTVHIIYQAGYKQLQETKESFIIQPTYNGIHGHPVFFGNIHKEFFAELKGDKGAKSMMKNIHSHLKLTVKDKGILFDIDTPSDYELAKHYFSKKIKVGKNN